MHICNVIQPWKRPPNNESNIDRGFGLGLKNVGLPEIGLGEKIGLGLEFSVAGLRFCCDGWGIWGLGGLNPCGLELIITGLWFCCVVTEIWGLGGLIGFKVCSIGWIFWGLGGLNPCGIRLSVTGLWFCCRGRGIWGLWGLNPWTSFVSTNIGTKAPENLKSISCKK